MSAPWSRYIEARRAAHRKVVDRPAGKGWTSPGDAWDEAGPMGIAEWCAADLSREALRLLDFVEAMAGFADQCEGAAAEARARLERSRAMDYAFFTQGIRAALTALTTSTETNNEEVITDDSAG